MGNRIQASAGWIVSATPQATARPRIEKLRVSGPLKVIGRVGQDFLELAEGHQRSGEGQGAQQHFDARKTMLSVVDRGAGR